MMHRSPGRIHRAMAGAFVGAILPVVALGCSATPAPSASDSSTTTTTTTPSAKNIGAQVGIRSALRFEPADVTIKVNQNVNWTNDGSTSHTVKSKDGQGFDFSSETIAVGQSYQLTFTTPGTYNYFCSIHGEAMKGTVTVTA